MVDTPCEGDIEGQKAGGCCFIRVEGAQGKQESVPGESSVAVYWAKDLQSQAQAVTFASVRGGASWLQPGHQEETGHQSPGQLSTHEHWLCGPEHVIYGLLF